MWASCGVCEKKRKVFVYGDMEFRERESGWESSIKKESWNVPHLMLKNVLGISVPVYLFSTIYISLDF